MVCLKCKNNQILGQKELDKKAPSPVFKKVYEKFEEKEKPKFGIINKFIQKKSNFDSYAGKCKTCKGSIPKNDKYCHSCSYEKGLCKMCGVKILNVKCYRQSNI